jgi:hypothetical protein
VLDVFLVISGWLPTPAEGSYGGSGDETHRVEPI